MKNVSWPTAVLPKHSVPNYETRLAQTEPVRRTRTRPITSSRQPRGKPVRLYVERPFGRGELAAISRAALKEPPRKKKAKGQAARCCPPLMSDFAGIRSPSCRRQIIFNVSGRLRASTS